MDYFWSLAPRAAEYKRVSKDKSASTASVDELEHAEESRADIHRPSNKYSFLAMLAYLFYIPLYIAGPITSFNSFSSCMERRQQSHSMAKLLRMLARVFAMGIALEVSVHYFYYIAISEAGAHHRCCPPPPLTLLFSRSVPTPAPHPKTLLLSY